MCGISGCLNYDPRQPVEDGLLRAMNAAIRHRGPDDEGIFVDGNVGLGVRRLAIIDLPGGHQPIANEDGTVVVSLNGEIYNFKQLRDELIEAGHIFRTKSDVEVIVHGYEEWGDAVLVHLVGMFALALWDGRQHRLLLARDRMGEKPLCWHSSPRGLAWASEPKALLVAPWIVPNINPLALHHYLTLQYTPDPLTIYEGINQLPAAHKLVVEREGAPVISRWWQLDFDPKWTITKEDAKEGARSRLAKAVERCLMAEVPLGAFLSGGIDSSVIVALMTRDATAPVDTFSIAFEEPEFSEAPYARLVADHLRTRHHEFTFSPSDVMACAEGVVSAADAPFADPAALMVYELARRTAESVTVTLTGDGGDETLAGYMRYPVDRLFAAYSSLPQVLTRHAIPALVGVLPERPHIPEDRNIAVALKRLESFATVTPKASLVRWGSFFSHDQKLDLYADRWRDEIGHRETASLIATFYDEARATSAVDRTLAAEHATYLAGDLLPKTDRMTMAHSLEARAPFLDVDWVEWTARLPVRYKMRGLTTKWLLRQAFKDLVPSTILERGKQGFSMPIGSWLKGPLRAWCHERVIDNRALSEWFRPQAIQRLMDEHNTGRVNHGKRLWALVMFAVWIDRARPRTP